MPNFIEKAKRDKRNRLEVIVRKYCEAARCGDMFSEVCELFGI